MYLVWYSEITLKGKNRRHFEDILLRNIQQKCHRLDPSTKVKRAGAKFCIFSVKHTEIENICRWTPGIATFAYVEQYQDFDEIQDAIIQIFRPDTKSFKIQTKRIDKKFPFSSMEVNQRLGAKIQERFGTQVDLDDPDVTVYLSIENEGMYLYRNKHQGMSGLPVGVSGKVVSLISGGIDSPVASTMMMERGCRVVGLHASMRTLRPKSLQNKISQIEHQLQYIDPHFSITTLPFDALQKEIVTTIPGPYRMIVFKRSILRIANLVAHSVGAQAIITGDSMGQVASQTIENIRCTHCVSGLPILTPLIGMSKERIVQYAQKIQTFDISTQPYEDCCSLIATKHPNTKGKGADIDRLEKPTQLYRLEDQIAKEIAVK